MVNLQKLDEAIRTVKDEPRGSAELNLQVNIALGFAPENALLSLLEPGLCEFLDDAGMEQGGVIQKVSSSLDAIESIVPKGWFIVGYSRYYTTPLITEYHGYDFKDVKSSEQRFVKAQHKNKILAKLLGALLAHRANENGK